MTPTNEIHVGEPVAVSVKTPSTSASIPSFYPWNKTGYRAAFRWLAISIFVGILSGSASALLLISLDFATHIRETHVWLIALLPIAGFLVALLYHLWGRDVERGNNLILDQIHDPKQTIRLRMTPLVLFGTIATHLFGGSAGREGTALQTGASLADQLGKPFHITPQERRMLLMAGLSGGFGSVFGVPFAGAVFGMEVLSFGHLLTPAIGPCIVASFIGDLVTRLWHVHHTVYHVDVLSAFTLRSIGSSLAAGAAFGLMALLFSYGVHHLGAFSKRILPFGPVRALVGGAAVASAVWALHTTRYIGLGVPVIVDAFHKTLPHQDFVMKALFTIVTLGFGFKGGEVTPLFYIGATMGNALAWLLPLPASLLAGMGFVAVFGGAAKTPIASTIMAFELFGPVPGCFAALACTASYLCSGKLGIYHSRSHK